MEQGPVIEGFDRIVRSVKGTPARRVQQIPARVQILVAETLAGNRIGPEQLAFEQRPGRGRHRLVEFQFGREQPAGQQQEPSVSH